MKFGKTDEEKKRSSSIYENLIVPALIDSGFDKSCIIRADVEAEKGGSIKKQIFSNLNDAEMVIADITGGNPNVFYELGIRHALKERGTVIICDEKEAIPFDLADDYVHPYTFRIDVLNTERKKLEKLINKRKTNHIDSPFFSRLNDSQETSSNTTADSTFSGSASGKITDTRKILSQKADNNSVQEQKIVVNEKLTNTGTELIQKAKENAKQTQIVEYK